MHSPPRSPPPRLTFKLDPSAAMTSTARSARQGRMNGLNEETLLSVEELMAVEADLRVSPLKNAFDGAEYDAQAILRDVRGGSRSYPSSSSASASSSSPPSPWSSKAGSSSSLTVRERQQRDSFVRKSLKHKQFRAEHHKSVLSSILASAEAVEDRKAREVLASVPWPQDFKGDDGGAGGDRIGSVSRGGVCCRGVCVCVREREREKERERAQLLRATYLNPLFSTTLRSTPSTKSPRAIPRPTLR